MNKYQHVQILLVEDSEHDAELTLRALKRRGLVNDIAWVRDGVEALDYLFCRGDYVDRDNRPPKLVLLDLRMPRMDGLQVLGQMKQSDITRHIPVVMLTTSREEGDLIKSYALGVNSYIVKPVDFEQFAQIVEQVGLYWVLANQSPG